MLPRLSWYQVNYQANTNKNGLRKYLAYSVTLNTQQPQGTRYVDYVDSFAVISPLFERFKSRREIQIIFNIVQSSMC